MGNISKYFPTLILMIRKINWKKITVAFILGPIVHFVSLRLDIKVGVIGGVEDFVFWSAIAWWFSFILYMFSFYELLREVFCPDYCFFLNPDFIAYPLSFFTVYILYSLYEYIKKMASSRKISQSSFSAS